MRTHAALVALSLALASPAVAHDASPDHSPVYFDRYGSSFRMVSYSLVGFEFVQTSPARGTRVCSVSLAPESSYVPEGNSIILCEPWTPPPE